MVSVALLPGAASTLDGCVVITGVNPVKFASVSVTGDAVLL